jgi:hypothetical protein
MWSAALDLCFLVSITLTKKIHLFAVCERRLLGCFSYEYLNGFKFQPHQEFQDQFINPLEMHLMLVGNVA